MIDIIHSAQDTRGRGHQVTHIDGKNKAHKVHYGGPFHERQKCERLELILKLKMESKVWCSLEGVFPVCASVCSWLGLMHLCVWCFCILKLPFHRILDGIRQTDISQGVPVIRAPFDAEAQCAEMAKLGIVYAAATEGLFEKRKTRRKRGKEW